MENFQALAKAKNEMVVSGKIVEAAEKYFAANTKTIDFAGPGAGNKEDLVKGLTAFVGSIAKVNQIKLHRAAADDNVSFAEFTFDFDMQDGSKIFWHEIIRSVWKDGLIVEEEYFKG